MVYYIKEAGTFKNQSADQKDLYNRILKHPQVLQLQISSYCLKLSIDGQAEKQLVPKLLLQVSARKLNNIMVSPPEEGGFTEAIDADNNIIIIDSSLCNILPPQMNKMTAQYKIMCSSKSFIYTKSMQYSLVTWRDHRLKHLKDRSHHVQNRSSG